MMKPRGPSVRASRSVRRYQLDFSRGVALFGHVVDRYRLRKDGDPGAGELSNLGRREARISSGLIASSSVSDASRTVTGTQLCATAPGRPSLVSGDSRNPSGNDRTSGVASALRRRSRGGVFMSADAVRTPLPLILIRGFGGLGVEDEKGSPTRASTTGPSTRASAATNYIYEGMILRFMKSHWQYQDATNVIGYYGKPVVEPATIPAELERSSTRLLLRAPATRTSRFEVQDRHRPGDGAAPPGRTTERSAADAVGLPLLRPRRAQLPVLRAGARPADRLHPGARGGEGRQASSRRSTSSPTRWAA